MNLFDDKVESFNCISLWQPWAMLWALGEKANETRHWQPPRKYLHSTIYIHAAKKWNTELAKYCQMRPFKDAFMRHLDVVGPDVQYPHEVPYRIISLGSGQYIKLPFGALIGKVKLIGDVPTERAEIGHDEEAFGDYTPGRWAWEGINHQVLDEYIPLKGAQGFFTYTPEVAMSAR